MKKKVFFGILILFVIGVLLSPLCFMSRIEGTWKPEKEGVVTVLLGDVKIASLKNDSGSDKKIALVVSDKDKAGFYCTAAEKQDSFEKGCEYFFCAPALFKNDDFAKASKLSDVMKASFNDQAFFLKTRVINHYFGSQLQMTMISQEKARNIESPDTGARSMGEFTRSLF